MEFVRHIHDYLNDYIRLADAKAGAIFLIASGMIGFLVKGVGGSLSRSDLDWAQAIWLSVAALLNFLTIVVTLLVTRPRLGKTSPKRLIYWRDILEWKSLDAYVAASSDLNPTDAAVHVAVHNWQLARIADEKYRLLTVAYALAAVSALVSLPFVMIY